MAATPPPTADARALPGRFVMAVAIGVFSFGAAELVIGLAFMDLPATVAALALVTFAACLLVARHEASQGRHEAAAVTIASALIAASFLLVLVQPFLATALAFVPFGAVALAAPLARGRALVSIMGAATVGAVTIVLFGTALPDQGALPGSMQAFMTSAALLSVGAAGSAVLVVTTERLRRALSESRAAHDALDVARVRLEEMGAMKARFMNAAAHELNTPLTPIRTQLHMLRHYDSPGTSDRARRAVEVLVRNIERLTYLVRDVTTAAAADEPTWDVEMRPVDLGALAQEAADTFTEHAATVGVTLVARSDAALTVNGDASRLTQALFNLVSNAIKFTPRGGVVTVDAFKGADGPTVRVTDTGLGLRPEAAASVFEPFQRLHEDVAPQIEGRGLGLYVTRRVAESHGGSVACTSEGPGRGACFTLTIPPVTPSIDAS